LALTSNQTTDVYLLGLAFQHGGKLASLDRAISRVGMPGSAHAAEIIPF
jgi:hypothetical protein